MFVLAARANYHTHVLALHEGVDVLHRCAKVCDIQTALQFGGNAGVKKIDEDLAGLFADIDAHTIIREADDDLAVAVRPAAEIDTLETVLAGTRGAGKARGFGRLRARHTAYRIIYRNRVVTAVRGAGVCSRLHQVQHDTCAVLRFDGVDADDSPCTHLDSGSGHVDTRVRKVERDARRVTGGEQRRLGGRAAHANLDLDTIAREFGEDNVLNRVQRFCGFCRCGNNRGWSRGGGDGSWSNRFRGRRLSNDLRRLGYFWRLVTYLGNHAVTVAGGFDLEFTRLAHQKVDIHTRAVVRQVRINTLHRTTAIDIGHLAQCRTGKV